MLIEHRLRRRGEQSERSAAQRFIRLDGADWVLAQKASGTEPAPPLPRT